MVVVDGGSGWCSDAGVVVEIMIVVEVVVMMAVAEVAVMMVVEKWQ